ncbi:MAG: hypothetical protein FJW30_01235 [Acidobacteria bacterium]|nr:hypothetical protein [Acidobacteriota bacterium]
MKFTALLLAGLFGVEAPPVAVVLDGGQLTRVYGLAGNFLRGESGERLLAYSFDGEIEWRLEPGRLLVRHGAVQDVLAVQAESAVFRGRTATLPDSRAVAWNGERIVEAKEAGLLIAGRAIEWRAGSLTVTQPDGTAESVDCPNPPGSLTAAGQDWAHFDGHLLRLTPNRVTLYILPARSRQP